MALAVVLVLGPIVFNLTRQSGYAAAIRMLPRKAGRFPPVSDPAYYRGLLRDPALNVEMHVRQGVSASDLKRVTIRRAPPGMGFIATYRARSATRARDVVNLLAREMANASRRQLQRVAISRNRRLRLRIRREPRGTRRAALRKRQRSLQRLVRAPEGRIEVASYAPPPHITLWADRIANALPGSFARRMTPAQAGIAGSLVFILIWLIGLVVAPPPGRRPLRIVRRSAAWADYSAHSWLGSSTAGTRPTRTATVNLGPLPGALLPVAVVLAAAYIMYVGRGTFFHADDWDMVVYQNDLSPATLFAPHVDHLVATQIAAFELLRAVAGWHYWVYRAVMALLHLTLVICLFVFARRRVGPWVALALVMPFLVFGAGADGVLWPGVMGNDLSLATGIAALLVVDRMQPSHRDAVAVCLLLLVSVASFTYGVVFCIAAGIWIATKPSLRRSFWAPSVPLIAYGVWQLAHLSSTLTPSNALHTPRFVVDSAGYAVGGLLGAGLAGGRVIALAGALAIAYVVLIRRGRPVSTYLIVALPLSTWILIGLGRAAQDEAFQAAQPRYIYAGAALTLLVLAEFLSGVEWKVGALATVGVLALGGTVANAIHLHDAAGFFNDQAQLARGYLGAMAVARPATGPHVTAPQVANAPAVTNLIGTFSPGSFDRTARQIGADPVSPGALRSVRPAGRRTADAVLVQLLRLRLAPSRDARLRPPRHRWRCIGIRGPDGAGELRIRGSLLLVRAGAATATVSVRRYADPPARVRLGRVAPRTDALLRIPRDGSATPWFARVAIPARGRVCD